VTGLTGGRAGAEIKDFPIPRRGSDGKGDEASLASPPAPTTTLSTSDGSQRLCCENDVSCEDLGMFKKASAGTHGYRLVSQRLSLNVRGLPQRVTLLAVREALQP